MVYYLSSNRNYGLTDMSYDNLKKTKLVGEHVTALRFLVSVFVIVMLVSVLVGLSKPQYMSDVDPNDSTKRVVNYTKVFGYSALYASLALVAALLYVKYGVNDPTA
jgi:hypothetical protein